MKIFQKDTGRVAQKFQYRDGSPPRYRVFPHNRATEPNGTRHLNTIQQEIAFDEIQHVAEFLMRHPRSAIRMNPRGVILSRGIVIDRDAEEPDHCEFQNDAEPGEQND